MELGEIINDALRFPFNNLQSIGLYLVLGFILALVGVITGATALFGVSNESGVEVVVAIIGLIIMLIIGLVIEGYALDIIKSGINRSANGPSIDLVRQAVNGLKLIIVQLVYYIVPILIMVILGIIFQDWIQMIIGLILFIVFGLAATMGECRLAKTDDLGYALNITEAIGDISSIGFGKVILTIVVLFVIAFIIYLILGTIFGLISQDLASIVTGIASVYILFFINRGIGLLYSDA